MDDCPGCQAEMDDAIKASVESAQQEDQKRQQEKREQEELQRIYAANAEENERQRRLADEEERVLQRAMEDSRREAEEEAQRRAHHEEVLLEESRQHALREREQAIQREAEMLEAAKLASAAQEGQRRREKEALQDAEKKAIQLSLQEQEEDSYFVPDPKRSSVSSLGVEQKGQRALAGVDFGYSSLPFAPKLDKSSLPSGASSSSPSTPSTGPASAATSRSLFPPSIELTSVTKVAGKDDLANGSFFVIRAPSWKSLLRAIAWYGNTRVEPSPEQVAAASDRRSRCVLRAEVEFITPTRVDVGHGVGEHARASLTTGVLPRNPSPAHVSLCLSILPGEASAWLKSEEYALVRRESRRLDAWYAGKGSTRRLIQLARQPPSLPAPLVQIAQMLHASHTFSAACPSSGSTARHSPRDLHHAIERHDQGFVQKQKAWLAASNALANPTDKRASVQSGTSPDEDDEDDDDDVDFGDFSLLADGSFDAQDKVLMGKRQRLKAKVKRRLGKRSGDGRVVDEDLAAWITPFDVSQHG
uniref:Uncharacterized protein n=1 Tax=Kalmanozyma brasiliensis (strain GHG001) TaxID=1365824 RepID=V5EHS4_KALBG